MNYKQENKVAVKVIFKSVPASNKLSRCQIRLGSPRQSPLTNNALLPEFWCNVPRDAEWIFEDTAWGAKALRLNGSFVKLRWTQRQRVDTVSMWSYKRWWRSGAAERVQADVLLTLCCFLCALCSTYGCYAKWSFVCKHPWPTGGDGVWFARAHTQTVSATVSETRRTLMLDCCSTSRPLKPAATTTSLFVNSNSPSESQAALSQNDYPLGCVWTRQDRLSPQKSARLV